MFSPNFFRYVQARSVYGNAFPNEKNYAKTHQYLQLLSSSQEKLVEKALDSQKKAILIFCYAKISQHLSLGDMIEIFLFYALLTENIITTPVFQDFAKNVTQEEFKNFFQSKCSTEMFKRICKIAESDFVGFNLTEESHALICKIDKMLPYVDFKKLNDKPAEDCRELLKKMLSMPDGYPNTFRSKLTRVFNALCNVNFILELKDLDVKYLMVFSILFKGVAEEVLKTPVIFNKLSGKQLESLCLQHDSVADKIIIDEALLRKTLSEPNVENERLMVQQAKLASPHSAIAKKLFRLFAPSFYPPYSSHDVTEQYGLCLFFLGKEQPSIAKEILETPCLRYLLNGQHLGRLERTVALWETMEKICIDLVSSPAIDTSFDKEISSEIGKLKMG